MKLVHPKLKFAASIFALAFLSSAAGCKNQQSAFAANPFLGPNRVPPPATRSLLPGQAQPYYQGDPLPVSQNGARQPAAVVQASAEVEMPSADGNLAWSTPSGALSKSNTGPATTSAPLVSSPPKTSVVAANESDVAIPDDGNSLRFALPGAQLAEPQAFTPTNPVALASTRTPTSAQPRLQLPSPPTSNDIAQAAYTEPVITNSAAPSLGSWRAPQIAQSGVTTASTWPANFDMARQPSASQPVVQPLANAPPSLPPTYTMPPVVAANTVDVRLREVPSPPLPRIRIPGYGPSVPSVGSADGFRPRTSMR